MRDVIVTALVLGALPFALRHSWVGVMLWTWLSIMNPHKLAFGFAHDAPFAAAAAGATLISLFVTRDKVRMAWDPVVKVLIVFVVWMCITTLVSVSPAMAWPQVGATIFCIGCWPRRIYISATVGLEQYRHFGWRIHFVVIHLRIGNTGYAD